MTYRSSLVLLLLAAVVAAVDAVASEPITVGSKQFTESVILGEMLHHLAEAEGYEAAHQAELGGTQILWNGLLQGQIDAYPEYTGTIAQEILAGEGLSTDDELRRALEAQGIVMGGALGFNNTYVLGMKEERAAGLGIRTISDLRSHPDLRLGFSNEFMDRGDGWPALQARYGLPHREVRGLQHDLAYRGLEADTIDVMDLYATDAEIRYYGLRSLQDDLSHFPVYDAVILYRADLAQRAPEVVRSFARLESRIDAPTMVSLNARAKLDKVPESTVAADFLNTVGIEAETRAESATQQFRRNSVEHLTLVVVSLGAAIVLAIPLGVAAFRRPRLGQIILALVGVVQTVPTLALLVFMIPLFKRIGFVPSVAALFLYSLLPIVRNTHAGLAGISPELIESAEALGLPPAARLRLVELPLALPSILAGIKISAVINVGTATLGALIGAGGYGQPILTGIRLNDVGLILRGAVPAAGLALLVQGLFELLERSISPRGLRT